MDAYLRSNYNQTLFEQWLISRRIVLRKEHDVSLCFDLRNFLGTRSLETEGSVYRYSRCDFFEFCPFPSLLIRQCEDYLRELQTFSIRKPLMTEWGESFVSWIKRCKDDAEPVWSSSRIQDPALLLLPSQERLFVDDTWDEIQITGLGLRERDGLGEKNNLVCVYGKYLFIAVESELEIFSIDSLVNDVVTDSILFAINMKSCDAYTVISNNQNSLPEFFNSESYAINFIKLSSFMGEDVLCVCLNSNFMYLIDVNAVIKEYEEAVNEKNSVIFNLNKNVIKFEVPESCWSVDIVENDNLAYVAMGHNGPGITIYAVERLDSTYSEKYTFHSKTVTALHNIPCLNFVSPFADDNGYMTLAYCSIYGSAATLKLKLMPTIRDLDIKVLDIQVFGAFCWTVTPLNKSDFKKVNEFEFLNLNYQENFKNSILYSAYQDSLIFNCKPASACCSNEMGLGALTTQIPVPVSDVNMRLMNGFESDSVSLRFTSFDERSKMSLGILKPEEYGDNLHNFEYVLNRSNTDIPGDRVKTPTLPDEITHYHVNESGNRKATMPNELARKYDQWCNSGVLDISTKNQTSPAKLYEFSPRVDLKKIVSKDGSKFLNKNHFGTSSCDSQKNNKTNTPKFGFVFTIKSLDQSLNITDLLNYYDNGNDNFFSYDSSGTENVSVDIELPKRVSISNITNSEIHEHQASQKDWMFHNHVLKVERLLANVARNSGSSLSGYKLKEFDSGFMLITTASHLYLVKTHPLIITSFTAEKIFPNENIQLCQDSNLYVDLQNTIKYVCHIKELNTIVVASSAGFISLLRLTEYNGIYSFRQEFLIGWVPQDPEDMQENHICFTNRLYNLRSSYFCEIDDVHIPYFNISGMDYNFVPQNKSNNIEPHAILYVHFNQVIKRFKISAGHINC